MSDWGWAVYAVGSIGYIVGLAMFVYQSWKQGKDQER